MGILRIHKWPKNLLLFVPLMLNGPIAFSFELLANGVIGFLSFSMCASSAYILNDIIDRETDSVHPRNNSRPLPSKRLTIKAAWRLAALMFLGALAIGAALPSRFLYALLVYIVITSIYTFLLKKILVLDVVALSAVHLLRIFAGGVVLNRTPSVRAAASFFFLFLAIGYSKRLEEIYALNQLGIPGVPGRPYGVHHLKALFIGVLLNIVFFGACSL